MTSAEARDGVRHGGFDRVLVGHVELQREDAVAVTCVEVVGRRGPCRGNHAISALERRQGERAPHASAGARDEPRTG
ncbi:hypothetical protein J2S48_004865 [Promicromonospora iranensis]|uniref:Uncharacterized protein n=1 Tax=Promicromonospora iranensis TaxID=1105144 RepID=A0ABU2CVI5_9MICO|nr:hypothetical protein [Promicromonospora iranensis]